MGPFKFRFRRTTLIIVGLVAFLSGLGIARIKLVIPFVFVLFGLGFIVITARKKSLASVVAIVIFGFVLGAWRGEIYMQRLNLYDNFYNNKVVVSALADNDAVYGNNGQLAFDITNIELQQSDNVHLVGKISVKGFGVPMVYRGDKILVSGKLYKTRGSKQASISFAQISVTKKSDLLIHKIRRNFEAGMQTALPEPMASFGLGMLIGQRTTLPNLTKTQLAATGLTHIVAVSGYNLTIIIRLVRRMLRKRSKYQITLASVLLMAIFLSFTGFSASIVRASMVSLLSLVAWYYGRQIRPVLLILLVASITAGFYPIYLWSDIGWYLSFLAFFGVMVLAPIIMVRLTGSWKSRLALPVVIETIAAQIMTWPLIIYIFNEFSVVAIVANLLVVPLVPIAMLLSLIGGLSGMLLPNISGWISWLPRLLLTYILDVVALLGRLPFALVRTSLTMFNMIFIYVVIVILAILYWYKNRGKHDIMDNKEEDAEGV